MPKSPSPSGLSRSEKAIVARKLHENLVHRAQKGNADPALDAFIAPLDAVATRLEQHVIGKDTASASRAAHAAHADKADAEVDTLCRHIEGFLDIEARRRVGPHVTFARALYQNAFPAGRSFLDDHIPEQNAEVRRILAMLRAPEHDETLGNLGFPLKWLDKLDAAVDDSDLAFAERAAAVGSLGDHVTLGREAEAAWVDVVGRLRKCVESRTPAGDLAAAMEARLLLAPLTNSITHAKTLAAARATRRMKRSTPPVAKAG